MLKAISVGGYNLSQEQADHLWERFKRNATDFVDFANPGEVFTDNELTYKRTFLQKFTNELGRKGIEQLLDEGKAIDALKRIGSLVQGNTNLVAFQSWRNTCGETKEQVEAVLRAFLAVSSSPYTDEETVRPLFAAIADNGLRPNWDVISVLLWALRPDDAYFPIKISYYRDLAKELGWDIGKSSATPEKLDRVLAFGNAIRTALQPLKPTDWIDAQSFIWICSYGWGEPQHWIFQANLQFYDIIGALRDGKLKSWTIKTHKDEIAEGDRVIVWVTGAEAGCYALCEVTSELLEGEDIEDHEYYQKEPAAGSYSYVELQVTENLWNVPITKNEVAKVEALKALKVGHQGTVFTATETEYEAMMALAAKNHANINGPNYWLYAPGKQSNNWENCWNKAEMVIGFDGTADLRSYKDRTEIEEAMAKTRTDKARPINDSLAAWDFLHQLRRGDIVIAKRGRQAYLGYGIVRGDYEYDANRETFRHIRKVEWIKRGEWPEISGPIVLKTLTDITKYPDYVAKLKALIGIEQPLRQSVDLPSKNVILYGPPGSGKTYALSTKYMQLFTDHESVKTQEEYADELVSAMAWWEVITMVMLDISSGKVADILSHPLLKARIRRSENNNPRAAVWAHIQMHTKRDCEHVAYTKRYEPLLFSKSDKSVWSIDKEAAHAEVPELEDKLKAFKDYSPSSASAIRRYAFTTFHQSFSYEDFIEGIKPVMGEDLAGELAYEIQPGIFRQIAQRAKNDPNHDYALFIDEINRGNIASIFGELITLLEDDKRLGEKHELTAILPYSRHEFAVPSNLYVIGTMNTADRSVEALDTALRRRFTFVECGPQPSLLKEEQPTGLDVNLEKLLTTINARIERLLDSDHCIGHSYFMGMKEASNPLMALRQTFANKVLPMLHEYFYGDPGRIGMVLGENFVQRREVAPVAPGDWGIDVADERGVYQFTDPMLMPAEAFVSIYE